ncbi:hypothetical protein GALL_444850 [mine drainage metagenome]|uniref:Uncharacterized protein n=1 Tax=mine drainage metagenome TaxID=410659 RepID=A0A1J5Q1H9_9ZZZZ
MRFDFVNAGNLFGQCTRTDDTHDIGYFYRPVVLLLLFINPCNQVEGSRRGFGMPHGFDRGHFGLLVFAYGITGFIAEHDY